VECRSLGCAQLTYQSGLAEKRNTKYGRNTKKYSRLYVSAVKTDVKAGRQTLGASVGGIPFLFSHAGFEALAKDVGSDGDLVGDPNLPLLLWSRCWRSFLLFGGISTLCWGR